MRQTLTIVGYELEAEPPPDCNAFELLSRREWSDTELLGALGELAARHPTLGVDIALRYRNGRKSLARLRDGRVRQLAARGTVAQTYQRVSAAQTPKRAKAAEDPRASMTFGTIDDRTLAIKATFRRLGQRAIPQLLEILDDVQHGADPDIRVCIYDVLSWNQTDVLHTRFIRALREEPDEVAAQVAQLTWRQHRLSSALPSMLSSAWNRVPRDAHHVDRLIDAVRANKSIELDRDWLDSQDAELVARLGRAPDDTTQSLTTRIEAAIERGLGDTFNFAALRDDIARASAKARSIARGDLEGKLMGVCNHARSPRVRGLAVELLIGLGTGRFRLAALSAGLPLSGTLRDALGGDTFTPTDPAWRTDGGHDVAVDLPALDRVLLCGPSGVTLVGSNGPIAALDVAHDAQLAGVVTATDGDAAMYTCPTTSNDGHALTWIRVTRYGLDAIGSLRLDAGPSSIARLGEGALFATDDGAAHFASHGELIRTWSAEDARHHIATTAGAGSDNAFLCGRGLHCIDATGATVWTNPDIDVRVAAAGAALALTADGLYCARKSGIARLDPDTGATLYSTPIRFTPHGLHVAGAAVVAVDGTRCFEEVVASGLRLRPSTAPTSYFSARLSHRATRTLESTTVELCRRGLIVATDGAEQLIRVPHPVCLGPTGTGLALVRTDGPGGPWLAYQVG